MKPVVVKEIMYLLLQEAGRLANKLQLRPHINEHAGISANVPPSLTRQRKMERPNRFASGDHCNREIPLMPIYERLLMISNQSSEQIAANECAEISGNAPPSLTRSRKMEKPGRFTNETCSSQGNYVPPTVRSRQSSEKTADKALINERTVISAKVPPKTNSKKMERLGGFTNETRSSRGNHVPPFARSRQSSELTAAKAHINERAGISANVTPSLVRNRKMEISVVPEVLFPTPQSANVEPDVQEDIHRIYWQNWFPVPETPVTALEVSNLANTSKKNSSESNLDAWNPLYRIFKESNTEKAICFGGPIRRFFESQLILQSFRK